MVFIYAGFCFEDGMMKGIRFFDLSEG